jgi:glycosyltransferase involved in cell wall biosynthesis
MKPQISIVTPSYNQGRYVERTIASVLSQHVGKLEYIVIDGGSTDETLSILKRYGDQLRWISEPDRGQSDAINKGVALSSAPIIGWLNSDDIYYAGALDKVLAYLDSNRDVDVVYGGAHHIDEDDRVIEEYPTQPWDWDQLKEICFISQPASFLRRRVFDDYGPLDVSLRYSMDYEYWLRLGKKGVRFAYLPQILAATRLHDDAATVAKRIACHQEINVVTRRHLGSTPDKWIFNYAHAVVERLGFSRSYRLVFAVAVSAVSWYASLRWNRRLSAEIVRTTRTWVDDAASFTVRQALSR